MRQDQTAQNEKGRLVARAAFSIHYDPWCRIRQEQNACALHLSGRVVAARLIETPPTFALHECLHGAHGA
jgi:hypothetical protein